MAYGEKYYVTYCDRFKKNCRLEIHALDYSGDPTRVKAGPIPFEVFKQNSSGLKIGGIYPTEATVTLVSDDTFNMEELYTTDERKYLIKHKTEGDLDWIGHVIPNGFDEEYGTEVHYMILSASDNLSTLQGLPFVDNPDEAYWESLGTFTKNGIWFITECLKKTDIALPLYVMVDVQYEGDTPDTDPLNYTYRDVRTYMDDDNKEGIVYYQQRSNSMSAWDVLNDLAKTYNAVVIQNKGRYEFKRVNADANDLPEKQWFIYDLSGAMTGRAPFGENTIEFPCKSDKEKFRVTGQRKGMDYVYKRVDVNYRYKYKVDGDSLINMIPNGNLSPTLQNIGAPPFSPNPATFTPDRWQRQKWLPGGVMYLTPSLAPGADAPPGFHYSLKIGGEFHQKQYITSQFGADNNSVSAGDAIRMQWWQKMPTIGASIGLPAAGSLLLYIVLKTGDENIDDGNYYLINDGYDTASKRYKGRWQQWKSSGDGKFYSFEIMYQAPGSGDLWRKIELDIPVAPDAGKFVVEIIGMGIPLGVNNIPHQWEADVFRLTQSGSYQPAKAKLTIGEFWLTGFFAARIVNTSNESVPQIHGYFYEQDGKYTDILDPIEVLTGDDDNPDHVSNIYVLQGSQMKATRSWDDWGGSFGYSALGLLLAKSVMQLYYKPGRVLTGTFVADGIDWSTRFEFEEMPGKRFIIARGSIDRFNGSFSGTLVQVLDINVPDIPPGGNDGGNNTDPDWQPTGNWRCHKDSGDTNDGYVEFEEIDQNPASQSFGQTRWVLSPDADTLSCPIGEPDRFIWGADIEAYDVDNFQRNPFSYDNNTVTVPFTNDGTGKYLFFLHQASLGTLYSVLDVEGDETFSSWETLAPAVIDGDTYTVWRMKYLTGTFTALNKTFRWQ